MPASFTFARSSAGLKRSHMRDLLALTARPGVLSLAGGLPAQESLPAEELQTAFDAVLTRDGGRALQYGPPYPPLKEQIALYMRSRGVACGPDDIFITNGSQQGLEIVMRSLLDPGETALIEEYTFTGILQATAGRGARLCPLPVDMETGVDLEAFESALESRPRLAVVIPDFHNPLGVSLPETKRIRLAALAARHNLPLIEDDPYSALRFAGDEAPPIKAYDDAGVVIYLGSFSKMLAPAMRLGWMVAPRDLLPKFMVVRESLDLESSQLTQRAVAEFLSRGWLGPHLARLNALNRERQAAMLAALRRELDGLARWTTPQGGLFVWVTVPGIDTDDLFKAALERNVAFVPGRAFIANNETPAHGRSHGLRLNFSNASPDMIDVAIRRLAEAVKEQALLPAA